jgi:hypothetical protein
VFRTAPTPAGRWLRRYARHALPALVSVTRGEMRLMELARLAGH